MNRFWKLLASLPLLVMPLAFTLDTAAQKKVVAAIEVVDDERAGRPVVKGQLLVTLYDGVKIDDLKPIFARLDAKFEVVESLDRWNHHTIATDHERLPELKQRLENHPFVASAAFNGVSYLQRESNDPVFKKPKDMREDKDNWNLYRINVPDAWDITMGGTVVAVIDTGAKLDHEELDGRITKPYSFETNSERLQEGVRKIKRGEKKYSNEDVRNHGTHVAVTIGGKADNGLGTAGVAPKSPLMPLQALVYRELYPNEGAGLIRGFDGNIGKAMVMAMDRQASVINMSLGGVNQDLLKGWRSAKSEEEKADFASKLLAQAEDGAKNLAPILDRASRTGVIVVVAAGNDNMPAEFGSYTFSRRTISVAATTRDDTRAIFSNYGESTTVSAPGHEIWSGLAEANKPYSFMSGTSMACPHAAGVVSLMQSVDPTLKLADVAEILIKTGRPLETDVPIGPLINAKGALDETMRRKGMKVREPEPPPLVPAPPMNPTQPRLPDDGIDLIRRPDPWNNPNIQRLIRVWLAFANARPPAGTDPDIRWFFNLNGQAVNNQNFLLAGRPIWFRFNYRMMWENAAKLESTNLGTLYEFTAGTLRLGKFDSAPTRVPEKVRPKKDDSRPPGLPFDPGLMKTKWTGKNGKGDEVKFDFDPKGVSVTRNGIASRYAIRLNTYAHPMTFDLFPVGGGDPIRGLLHLNDLADLTLRTNFTKIRPAKLTSEDPEAFRLKRIDLVVNKAPGFAQGDGMHIDPRFADAVICDGTTDCAGDCGKFAGNNTSAGPNTAIASMNLKKAIPVVGHSWVIRKFTNTAGPQQFLAKSAKDPRYSSKTFDNGMAGFIVKARSVGADQIKDTIETYAKIGKPFENSSHTNMFIHRGIFLVTYTLWEPKRGHDFSAESKRIEERSRKLIDERFP